MKHAYISILLLLTFIGLSFTPLNSSAQDADALQERKPSTFKSIYPNPARDHVLFSVELEKREAVTIELYNQIGKKVATIEETQYTSGKHEIYFETSTLNKGLYFVHVSIGSQRFIRKFSILS